MLPDEESASAVIGPISQLAGRVLVGPISTVAVWALYLLATDEAGSGARASCVGNHRHRLPLRQPGSAPRR